MVFPIKYDRVPKLFRGGLEKLGLIKNDWNQTITFDMNVTNFISEFFLNRQYAVLNNYHTKFILLLSHCMNLN